MRGLVVAFPCVWCHEHQRRALDRPNGCRVFAWLYSTASSALCQSPPRLRRLHLVLLFSFGVQPHKSNTTSWGANHSYKPLCSIASHCCRQKTPSNNQRNRLCAVGWHDTDSTDCTDSTGRGLHRCRRQDVCGLETLGPPIHGGAGGRRAFSVWCRTGYDVKHAGTHGVTVPHNIGVIRLIRGIRVRRCLSRRRIDKEAVD